MKIRKGFVSNSSSSSYVIIGERINFKDIDFSKLKNDEKYLALGGAEYFEYGKTVFYFNQEMIGFIKKNADKFEDFNFEFIKAVYEAEECNGDLLTLNENHLQKNLKIWAGECDQHTPYSVMDLKELIDY